MAVGTPTFLIGPTKAAGAPEASLMRSLRTTPLGNSLIWMKHHEPIRARTTPLDPAR
jgi:hypothetical protein